MSLELGIKGSSSCTVTQDLTAKALRSGGLDVFATPIMIALMEEASLVSVRPYLEPGMDTVGTHLDVSHLSPTPVGMKVWAEAELTAVEGKKLTFSVKAFDEAGAIGGGTHERFIITVDRFLAKAEAKKGGC